MSTFQALIDAFLHALTQILPISEAVENALLKSILGWPTGSPEVHVQVFCMAALVFIIFFRFDWLGMFSAFIRSVFKPFSLKSELRSLDQHTLIFLILVFLPAFLLKHFLEPVFATNEILIHPFVNSALTAALAFGFYFSRRWNKRVNGLNHLKIADGFFIGFLTLLSAHPTLPYLALLWIGFALRNFHYEAVFKYSMLALGLTLVTKLALLLTQVGLITAIENVGYLNSMAILVVSFVTFWMTLDHLQNGLSESTFRTLQWLNIFFAGFFVLVYFLRIA